MIAADLHMHTRHSDGLSTTRELFEMALVKKLRCMSITDHDTLAAYDEARELAQRTGVQLISGVEISCEHGGKQLHLLAYGFQLDAPELNAELLRQRQARFVRLQLILDKLTALGMPITRDDLPPIGDGASPGRPHVARALIAKGYVKNLDEAFYRFLGGGQPAYVPSTRLTLETALQRVQASRGIATLAHPGLYGIKDPTLLTTAVEMGLGGVEVYHPKHNNTEVRKWLAFAEEHSLLVTGGSDFHGDAATRRDFGAFGLDTANFERFRAVLERL